MPFADAGYASSGTPPNLLGRLTRRWRWSRFHARQQALEGRGWYDLSARSEAPAVFVGGCGRSGTTLVRELLNRHPRLACGPETSLFGLPFDTVNLAAPWGIAESELTALVQASPNLVAFAEAFFQRYLLEPEGKARWADKTPNNVRALPRILTCFPNARFIHVLRDGRDVVCSLRTHPREKFISGKLTPVKTNNPIPTCALRWLTDTALGLAFRGHPRYLEIRYEQLVAEPEATLRAVCAHIGEDYDAAMLEGGAKTPVVATEVRMANNQNASEPISSRSVGRWARDLSPEEQRSMCSVAGELLIVTGYADDDTWVATV